MIIGNTKGFIRGKALSVEGHIHTGYAASSHTHTTSQVTGLDTELSSLKSSVSNGKSLIASAITDKGVSTASNATFQTMAYNIGNIKSMSLDTIYTPISNISGSYSGSLGYVKISGLSLTTVPSFILINASIQFGYTGGAFRMGLLYIGYNSNTIICNTVGPSYGSTLPIGSFNSAYIENSTLVISFIFTLRGSQVTLNRFSVTAGCNSYIDQIYLPVAIIQ